jgi:hypothetical protein
MSAALFIATKLISDGGAHATSQKPLPPKDSIFSNVTRLSLTRRRTTCFVRADSVRPNRVIAMKDVDRPFRKGLAHRSVALMAFFSRSLLIMFIVGATSGLAFGQNKTKVDYGPKCECHFGYGGNACVIVLACSQEGGRCAKSCVEPPDNQSVH